MKGNTMYRIQCTDFGYIFAFRGVIEEDEMAEWVDEIIRIEQKRFNLIFDMRGVASISPEVEEILHIGQQTYEKKGVRKAVVIQDSLSIGEYFDMESPDTGTGYKIVDALTDPDWEEKSFRWVCN